MNLNAQHLLQTKAYINGEWADGTGTFPVINPATGENITYVTDISASDINMIIQHAETAQKPWAALKAKDRANILRGWYNLIVEHVDDLAQIVTAECGKPIAEAKGEILYGASFIEWFAEEGKRAYGQTIPTTIDGSRMLTIKQPIGVCAAITPWNFPSAMITRKIAPALAAGCSVICKPAEDTPLSALALAALAEEAGIPAGIINIVTSSDAKGVGQALCDSPIIRKLSFTGSTRTGKILMEKCAGTMKRLSFELGGNAPFIVFEDADIDKAVDGAMICKFRNAGQTCVCANRFYVHESIYDEFIEKFKMKTEALKVGNGTNTDTQIGPLINKAAIEKVERIVKNSPATVQTGGQKDDTGELFYTPTILSDVEQGMECVTEEIFGPVAPIIRFSSEGEAITCANDTNYGLAAYFYALDMARIWRVSEALEYGMVGVNSPILSTEVAPFGGIKESGVGREGAAEGLDEYLETKYILMSAE